MVMNATTDCSDTVMINDVIYPNVALQIIWSPYNFEPALQTGIIKPNYFFFLPHES